MGEGAVNMTGRPSAHKRQRTLLAPALSLDAVARYLPSIQATCTTALVSTQWGGLRFGSGLAGIVGHNGTFMLGCKRLVLGVTL
jgi:hypothetical protein